MLFLTLESRVSGRTLQESGQWVTMGQPPVSSVFVVPDFRRRRPGDLPRDKILSLFWGLTEGMKAFVGG